MLKRLAKQGHLVRLPDLPIPRYPRPQKRPFTPDEMKRLFAAATWYLKGVMLMVYKNGFRLEEALNLTWDRVDFESGLVTLLDDHTKTRVGRTIAMNSSVRAWLLAQKEKMKSGEIRDSKFVFQSTASIAKNRDCPNLEIGDAWAKVCEVANVPAPNTPNCLRHTHLNDAAEKVDMGQISMVEVVRQAGTSLTTFQKNYMDKRGRKLKAVAEVMDKDSPI
jgi:integrase